MGAIPLRRSEGLAVFGLTAVLTAGSCFLELADWVGSWGESGAALEDATILLLPLIAALSAWLCSAPRRRRYEPLLRTAARPLHHLYLRSLVQITGCAAGGFLLAAAIVYVRTAGEATYGSPSLLVPLVIVCGIFAAAALGLLAGTMLPAYVGPVTALAFVYALEFLADAGNPSLAPLAGLVIADDRDRTYMYTVAWVLAVKAAWLLAVGLLLVTFAARKSAQWLMACALACLLSVPLLLTGDAGLKWDKAAAREVCQDYSASVTICLTAARAHVSDGVWAAVRPEVVLLDGFLPARVRFVEQTLTPDLAPKFQSDHVEIPFGVANGVTGDAHKVDPQALQLATVEALLISNCAPDTGDRPATALKPATATDVIELWLFRKLSIPTDGTAGVGAPLLGDNWLDYAPVQAFRDEWDHASAAQRARWLTTHRTAMDACTVTNPRMGTS